MAGTSFRQTDLVSACAAGTYCYPFGSSGSPTARGAVNGGTAGSKKITINAIAANSTAVRINWVAAPSVASWPSQNSGAWQVNLQVVTPSNYIYWTKTYICRLNSSCTNLETIASVTVSGMKLNTAGIYTHNLTGNPSTWNPNDRVVYVLAFQNIHFLLANTFDYKSSQPMAYPAAIDDVIEATPDALIETATIPAIGEELEASPASLVESDTIPAPDFQIEVAPATLVDPARIIPPRATMVPVVPVPPAATVPPEFIPGWNDNFRPQEYVPPNLRAWSLNACDNVYFGRYIDANGDDRPVTLHPVRADDATIRANPNAEVCRHHLGRYGVNARGDDVVAYCVKPSAGDQYGMEARRYVAGENDPLATPGDDVALGTMPLPPHFVGMFFSEAGLCGVPE